jgi:multidrug efflux pump subunit AcrB
MKGLIQASLGNPYAVIVMTLTVSILGSLALLNIPVDILPVFKSPAVQVLTFYGGMPALDVEKMISTRMEKWAGQANGIKRVESRSIVGASIVRLYFHDDQDPSAALTQVSSLAMAALVYMPPGTLPPVVMPFDPTSTTPICLIAMDSKSLKEEKLYDVGRLEVRNMAMQNRGTNAPVVVGGKLRAVIIEVNPRKLQARNFSSADILHALERSNVFFPSGNVKIGDKDMALASNSLFVEVKDMGDIPINPDPEKFGFLSEVAEPKDSSFIQTSIVLINGRKQVYVPIYRQVGASTLDVVDTLRDTLPEIKAKLTEPDIDLKVVMDQSVYVRASIEALRNEGLIGAILCSLVILLFLGQWRMTIIAILTLPLSVLAAITCLHLFGFTINVMTLAGLTLAIGPMIDSAIICLENTHRHLTGGASPKQAALDGASEVAMPELVSTLCTFLVLMPLIFVPGTGRFLFLPMALAVMFAMTAAYILSRTFVPCASAFLLAHHDPHAAKENLSGIARAFAVWEGGINAAIRLYVRALDFVLAHRGATIAGAFGLLAVVLIVLVPTMRRDFFPEVDSGAFEIAVRAPSGTRIEVTEDDVEKVNKFVRDTIKKDLQIVVAEVGVSSDWSAAYTPNSGPMDAVLKVQLHPERSKSAQEYVRILRQGLRTDPRFAQLDFSFDSGGLVRGALNEGKSSPINIQLVGKNQATLFKLADMVLEAVSKVRGVADARKLQRPDAPELMIKVDRTAASNLGLSQEDIMKNVIAATNSSIMFNKKNIWFDKKSGNQYYVGVQFPDKEFQSIDDILNIQITSPKQPKSIPLRNIAEIVPAQVPTEVHHVNLQPAIDITMNVEGLDLGHVSDEVARVLEQFGKRNKDGSWTPYDPQFLKRDKDSQTFVYHNPSAKDDDPKRFLEGSKIVLAGEYTRMQDTFKHLGGGLLLASLLIYFLMVALDKSFLVPLTVMLIVPLCLIGILPALYVTGSAINVQSLLGFIFIVGIKVANTVLMTDYAQELRRHEGLSPIEAIRKAAALRVRPVTMTALAAFFAMIPTALSLERGSEANAPLARAILGGLLAGEPATLFVLPALYALMIRDKKPSAGAEHHEATTAPTNII